MKAHELMNVLDTNPTQKFYDDIVLAFSLHAEKAKEDGDWSVSLRIMLPEKGRLETSNLVHFTPDNSVSLDEIAANLSGYLRFYGYRCLIEFEPVRVTEFPVGEPEVSHTALCVKIIVSWRHLLNQHHAENTN